MDWTGYFVLGIGLGAALAFVVWGIARWLRPRPSGTGSVPPSVLGSDGPDGPPGPGTVAANGPSGGTDGGWPGLPPPRALLPASDKPWVGPDPALHAPPPGEQLRLSRRIVLHLFFLGRFGPDEVAPAGATQGGIGAALHAEQSAVSKVLRRLLAAGVVEVSRRHVKGRDRRMNVYSLTRRGELLAHELRARIPLETVDGPATAGPSAAEEASPAGPRPGAPASARGSFR